MADIEARAEAEAAHKGLSGSARKSYIGGVWNRIRQAHAKATQPGGHAVPTKLFNRRARQQAREDARNAMRPHQEAIANIKKARDWRLGRHRDEPKPTEDRAATAHEILASDLKPIKHVEGRDINPAAMLDPYFLHEVYGQQQLRQALNLFPNDKLREGVEVVQERNPGTRPKGRSRAAMLDYIERHTGATPAPPAAPPAAPTPVAAPAPQAAPRPAAAPAAKRQPQGFPKPLTPIKPLPGFQLDATRRLDPYFIREHFGDAQLPEALSRQTPNNLHEAIEVIQEKTGKRYSGARSAPAMRAWILANM